MRELLPKVCRHASGIVISTFDLFVLAPVTMEETEVMGFFESLEQEKAQAERAKLLAQKKVYPIAPDGNTCFRQFHAKP
jgi:hypothetical protein